MLTQVTKIHIQLAVLSAALTLTMALPQAARGQDIDQLFREYNAQMTAGSYGEAVKTARRMVAIAPTTNWQAASLNSVGRALNSQLRFDEATPILEQALAIQLDEANSNRGWIPNNLGHNYRKRKMYAEAEKMFAKAQAEFERMYGAKSEQVATVRSNLGWLYYDQGQFDKAAETHAAVLTLSRQLFGDEDRTVGSSYNDLGTAQIGQGKYADSRKNLEKGLGILERTLGSESPDVATVLANLSDLHRAQKKFAQAEEYARKSLAIREKLLGRSSPVVTEQLGKLAADLKELGQTDEADAILADVAKLEKALQETPPAGDNPFRVGQRIQVKADQANVMAGAAVVTQVAKGAQFDVTHVQGKWCAIKLKVGEEEKTGWLDAADVTLATVGSAKAPPLAIKHEVVSTEGGFRILMPRQPLLTRQTENGIEHKAYGLEAPHAKFVAAWFDVPEGQALTFEAAQAAFADARGGKVETEDKVSLDDEFPGRDTLIRMPDGHYCRMRHFAAEARHYQLILEGTKELVTSHAADAFFNSFQRLPARDAS